MFVPHLHLEVAAKHCYLVFPPQNKKNPELGHTPNTVSPKDSEQIMIAGLSQIGMGGLQQWREKVLFREQKPGSPLTYYRLLNSPKLDI